MYKPTSPMQIFALPYKHFNNSQMEKDMGKKIKTKHPLVIQMSLKST